MNNIKINTIHMIGNAHIDPVWLWQWTEGYQETRATFRSALDRMKEFPDFIFTASQAAIYRWIEESEPTLFEEIRQRVQEGRWVIVNGWWMEPDCNIPSGESLARHCLYGKQYFIDKFGYTPQVGYCIDSFGHNGMLPQLLSLGGFTRYVFMRPNPVENPNIPNGPFWWESADGSRILTYRIIGGYGTGGEDINRDAIIKLAEYFTDKGDQPGSGINDQMFFYGVGDHGGGPTITNICSIKKLQDDVELPTIKFSSPDEYFTSLLASQPRLPVYQGEMLYHSVGCYSAHSGIKKWNRRAENDLQTMERWSVISHLLTGMPYPRENITNAWQTVLFNQFHDILAGTCIREAYDDVRDAFGFVSQTTKAGINCAIQRIASETDTRGGEMAVIVFNPHAFDLIKSPVEIELMTWQFGEKSIKLMDDKGQEIPWQLASVSAAIPSGWRKRLCFLVDVPALGYRVYHLNSTSQKESAVVDIPAKELTCQVVNGYELESDGKNDLAVENDYLRMEIDARLGDIQRLYDKRTGNDVFLGHAATGIVIDDPSDTWSHGVTSFRDECGLFADANVHIVESGSVRSVIRSRTKYNQSTLIQDFILYRELPWVEIRVAVDWHEQLKLLKLAFPVNIENAEATYETPYGVTVREVNGLEVPGQRWFDVTGKITSGNQLYGLSVLNDAKYSFDIMNTEMRMTVLRSPVYAHHTPLRLEKGEDYWYMDQGWHEFRYILLPHSESWKTAGTVKLANILNASPIAQMEAIHQGKFPQVAGHIHCSLENVMISVLKMAEDGDDIILRCYETTGIASMAVIEMPVINRQVEVKLAPWQIKTLRIPKASGGIVRETNFLE